MWSREPGFPTLVYIILEQQVSLASAKAAFTRLIEAASPLTPQQFLELDDRSLKRIGFSRQKARALRTLALGLERREIDLERLASVDDTEASARLRQLRGVGRWTAEYVLLRGLGRLQVFPGDDVGAQKSLARLLGRSSQLDYAGVQRATAAWRPYAGLVYFHLLLEGLSRSEELELGV